MSLFIGLMSGTSMDGIDAALVDTRSHTLLATHSHPYDTTLQQQLTALVTEQQCTLPDLNQCHTKVGHAFSEATQGLLSKAGVKASEIIAIGSHGQTICHDTTATVPYTLQLGCPHTIAVSTGLPVVADFRTRDLVLGGQGAPLAPMYHDVLFHNMERPLGVLNIGGIANITLLSGTRNPQGYDVGPGNCLMDAWAMKHLGVPYDDGGAWGATGTVQSTLLDTLLSEPFFQMSAPKSTGREHFSLAWLEQAIQACHTTAPQPQDVQATLVALTAMTIVHALEAAPQLLKHLLVCGGGARNTQLMTAIQSHLPQVQVESTERVGVNPDMLEAMMIAWLADKAWHKEALDWSHITGSRKPCVLGVVYR